MQGTAEEQQPAADTKCPENEEGFLTGARAVYDSEGIRGLQYHISTEVKNRGLDQYTAPQIIESVTEKVMTRPNMLSAAHWALTASGVPPSFSGIVVNQLDLATRGKGSSDGKLSSGQKTGDDSLQNAESSHQLPAGFFDRIKFF